MTATATAETTGAENVHWNLGDLYPGEPAAARAAVAVDLDRAAGLAAEFAAGYRGKVASLDAAALAGALARYKSSRSLMGRAASYAFLAFATDVADPERGALLQKVQEQLTQVGAGLIFLQLEWLQVADDRAEQLLGDAALANYRHYLESARRYKPYVLSEPEERVMVEKSVTARSAWDRLFEEATTAVKVKDGDEEVSLDVALSRMHAPEQPRRKAIAGAITEALREDLRTRRYIFNTILSDKAIDDRLRSYPHWLADRNLANEAPDSAVEALVDAVTSRYDITHRYYQLKKRLLGLEHFHDYDRYAPLGAEDPPYSWEQAREAVLDAYGSFSPRLRELALEFFDGSWIDAGLAPAKRGGAFAHQTIRSLHPYVMVNFTGKRRDVLVLAHELGHGVHMSLSRAQTQLNYDTPLTTAETASVFGETVTFQRILSQVTDPKDRLTLLLHRLDDAIATIYRQIAMNRFEDRLHTGRRAEGELSEEWMNRAWLDTQGAMLGPAVELSENYGIWWSYIPHFIGAPGYVYAYAFGNLFALAIHQKAMEEGPGFADKYFALLAAAGSQSPEDLGRGIGVDLGDPQFWHGGLNSVEALVDEAEKLSQQV